MKNVKCFHSAMEGPDCVGANLQVCVGLMEVWEMQTNLSPVMKSCLPP